MFVDWMERVPLEGKTKNIEDKIKNIEDKTNVRVVGTYNEDGNGNELICHRVCKKCNSLLEFKSGDVEIYNDENIHLEYIICPKCKKIVKVVCSEF